MSEKPLSKMRQKKHVSSVPAVLVIALLVALLLPAFAFPSTATADDTWEYSPYRVRVWLAVRPSAALSDYVVGAILNELQVEAQLFAGATWRLAAEPAPESIRASLVTVLSSVDIPQIVGASADALDQDKLLLLAVEEEEGEFRIACRELDCHARSFGLVYRSRTVQSRRLPHDCALAVARAFTPLVRVENSRGRSATARVRAGGLVRYDHCVSKVTVDDVFRPVIRRNDRRGEPKEGGIQEIEWTYLVVRQEQHFVLDCEVLSAMRNPLAGRSSASIEKLALRARPRGETTQLQLLARGENKHPLEGYEIFAKRPLPPDSEEKNTAVRLGLTDWRGMITVPPEEVSLRLVYVKNGSHLLARIPVVPGYLDQVKLELPSDDKRLEAEAFVKGMESMVMDLVARREILSARIDRRISQGKFKEAHELLEEIKSFRTKDDLDAMLTSRQQAGLASSDEREQQRIDYLLRGTRILLSKYLGPDKLVALERKVAEAEETGGATAKSTVAEAEPDLTNGNAQPE